MALLEIPKNRGCDKCGIAELPYRARHCHDCNKCVRKFDHHCFWIGGCVGELNHGKFWLFIFTQTVVFVMNIGQSMSGYLRSDRDFPNDKKMRHHVEGIWMLWCFILYLFIMLTGGLTFYHTYLICSA